MPDGAAVDAEQQPAADTGPLARAAELRLRVAEEARARGRAEQRLAVAEQRIAAHERLALEREQRLDALREGLTALRGELDGLREVVATLPAPEPPAEPVEPPSPLAGGDESRRLGELARGARELLAGGRLEAADEVIRGLEDAAARLRAQAPEAVDDDPPTR